MKYEFHVGDYIESFDGSVGYLTKVETWYSGTVGNDVVHLQGSTTFDASCGFTPFTITIPLSDISKYFNRIGQYDFTKPEVKKIEHFEYNYPCSEIRLTAKINELVDAVNELRKEIT